MNLGYAYFIFLVYCVTYYAIHSIMASDFMKSKINWSPQAYRLLFNFIAIITLLPGIIPFRMLTQVSSETLNYPAWLFYLGVAYASVGTVIILLALKNYDLLEFSGLGKAKPNEDLRVNGLNKFVRHPLYSGIFLLVWGMYLATMEANFSIIAAVTSIYIYFGTKLEERKLVDQFGEKYLKYRKEVPMFVPKIR